MRRQNCIRTDIRQFENSRFQSPASGLSKRAGRITASAEAAIVRTDDAMELTATGAIRKLARQSPPEKGKGLQMRTGSSLVPCVGDRRSARGDPDARRWFAHARCRADRDLRRAPVLQLGAEAGAPLDEVLALFARHRVTGILATSRPNTGTHALVAETQARRRVCGWCHSSAVPDPSGHRQLVQRSHNLRSRARRAPPRQLQGHRRVPSHRSRCRHRLGAQGRRLRVRQ